MRARMRVSEVRGWRRGKGGGREKEREEGKEMERRVEEGRNHQNGGDTHLRVGGHLSVATTSLILVSVSQYLEAMHSFATPTTGAGCG